MELNKNREEKKRDIAEEILQRAYTLALVNADRATPPQLFNKVDDS
jgi:hypothetical protein